MREERSTVFRCLGSAGCPSHGTSCRVTRRGNRDSPGVSGSCRRFQRCAVVEAHAARRRVVPAGLAARRDGSGASELDPRGIVPHRPGGLSSRAGRRPRRGTGPLGWPGTAGCGTRPPGSPGTPISTATRPSATHCGAAALARFHRAARGESSRLPLRRLHLRSPVGWHSSELDAGLWRQLITPRGRRPAATLRASRQLLAAYARGAPQRAQQMAAAQSLQVPLQVCHGDLWHDHVLYRGQEVTGLIDFGAMGSSPARPTSPACWAASQRTM